MLHNLIFAPGINTIGNNTVLPGCGKFANLFNDFISNNVLAVLFTVFFAEYTLAIGGSFDTRFGYWWARKFALPYEVVMRIANNRFDQLARISAIGAAESGDARSNFFQKLGSGGLADVEAVEIDWFTEAMQYSDLLAPVADDLKGRWLDWKEAAATDAAGNLVAYGTDIGPQGICYRSDLFAAAGLPTEARSM